MADELFIPGDHASQTGESANRWDYVQLVLDGSVRPVADPAAVKLMTQITASPCDVQIRPGTFELWEERRPHHTRLPFALAAPVLHQLMRLMAVSRLAEAQVGVVERAPLSTPFPGRGHRALWIVPAADQVEIRVREVPRRTGFRAATKVPESGPWALPLACPRNEMTYVAAAFPCPRCGAQPAQFQQREESTFLCPACGESFVPRISRF